MLYLLADHLDAVLAAGEDMLSLDTELRNADLEQAYDLLPHLVSRLRALEITLTTRTLQARTRAAELACQSADIDAALRMFAASTTTLVDAVTELADTTGEHFDAGADPVAYLRSRGVIPPDAGAPSSTCHFAIDDTFLVARRVPLGPLLDMAGRALDLLDAAYGLYDDSAEASAAANPHHAADQPSSRPQKLGQP